MPFGHTNNPSGKGGYAKGHKRGGRPARAVEERYLRATITCCPLKDWKGICRKAVELAGKGDAKARQWLSTLIVGADPIALRLLAGEVEQALEEARGVPGSGVAAEANGAAHTNGHAS
jgi:hypothetical protein